MHGVEVSAFITATQIIQSFCLQYAATTQFLIRLALGLSETLKIAQKNKELQVRSSFATVEVVLILCRQRLRS